MTIAEIIENKTQTQDLIGKCIDIRRSISKLHLGILDKYDIWDAKKTKNRMKTRKDILIDLNIIADATDQSLASIVIIQNHLESILSLMEKNNG